MRKKDKERLDTFERKILRILGSIRQDDDTYRMRFNEECFDKYNDLPSSMFIKLQKINWAGHIVRMSQSSTISRFWTGRPDGKKSSGRPKLKWNEMVEEDLKKKINILKALSLMGFST